MIKDPTPNLTRLRELEEKVERLMEWAYERGKVDHRAEVGRMFRELMGP